MKKNYSDLATRLRGLSLGRSRGATLGSLPLDAATGVARFLPNASLRQAAKASRTMAVAANAELGRRRRAYERRGDRNVHALMDAIGPVAEATLLGDRTRLRAFTKADVAEECKARTRDLLADIRLPEGLGIRFAPPPFGSRRIDGSDAIKLAAYVNPEAAALLPGGARDPTHLVSYVEDTLLSTFRPHMERVTYDAKIIDHYKRILAALPGSRSGASVNLWTRLLFVAGPQLWDTMIRRGLLTAATLREILTTKVNTGYMASSDLVEWMLERVGRAYGSETAVRIAIKSRLVKRNDLERFLSRLPPTMNHGAVSARRKEPLLHALVRTHDRPRSPTFPATVAFLRRAAQASKNARDHKGRTALHVALPKYRGMLFREGVDPMATDHRGRYFVDGNRSYSTSASG